MLKDFLEYKSRTKSSRSITKHSRREKDNAKAIARIQKAMNLANKKLAENLELVQESNVAQKEGSDVLAEYAKEIPVVGHTFQSFST